MNFTKMIYMKEDFFNLTCTRIIEASMKGIQDLKNFYFDKFFILNIIFL